MRFTLVILSLLSLSASAQTPAQLDFFESKVRPILVNRCGSCHGDKAKMGGVQLISRDGLHTSGVVIPGDVESTRLIRAVRYADRIKMPPTGKLPGVEIDALVKWVADGAVWPETSSIPQAAQSRFWAFQPVKKPVVPTVKNASWTRSDIDRFILARLEEKGLAPVRDADRYSLLRRVTLDLTGLLPTPDEIDAFVNDSSPQAFECVVDRLLTSPAYGDRWGRHWLDVTYWADTTGVGRRIPLHEAWRYRDYVINSFNNDKPYDRFVREQIAGPSGGKKGDRDIDSMAATGFLVLGPWAWFSYDKVQLRADVADLQADLVGRTFLGLTVGCARCHDHKFDPIPNKDYFGLVGIFLSTKTLSSSNSNGGINLVPLPETTADVRRYADDLEKWEKRVAEVEAAEKENRKEQAELKKRIDGLKLKGEGNEAEIAAAEKQLATAKKKSGSASDRQIAAFTRYMKPKLAEVYAAQDMEYPEDARIAVRGDAHQLGDSTPRRFLSAVTEGPHPSIDPQTSGREELADWIADEKNPLTARVYVNRIWHHLFGDGIVATTENFGARGEPPTHPELLEYLATRLVENGWSTKRTIREIVLSRVYRISSMQDVKANEADADNKLLWRASRRRLEVEAIRDTILQVSGRLDPARGGPSLPLTAQNVHTIAPFFLEEDSIIEDRVRNRRTVYQPVMRGGQMTDVDILNLFDFADPDQVVGTRSPTTVPTQTLYLMNSAFIKDEARHLAEMLVKDAGLDDAARVSKLTLLALNRPSTERDIQQARQFLSDFEAGLGKSGNGPDPVIEAWARYCQAIFASSEFLYRR